MSRPVVPTKVCPNCHLLHARWGGNCMERMQEEIAMLRAELEAAREPTPSHAYPDNGCLHQPYRGNDGWTYCGQCGSTLHGPPGEPTPSPAAPLTYMGMKVRIDPTMKEGTFRLEPASPAAPRCERCGGTGKVDSSMEPATWEWCPACATREAP